MKSIILNHGIYTIVDDDIVYQKWFLKYKWYARKRHGNYYAARTYSKRFNGTRNVIVVYLHRMITNCPKGFEVHHINGDTLDNRRENLMVLTPKQHTEIHKKLSVVDII
jgi:hypothetical protein